MCWNSLSVVVYSVVLCALFDFGPSRVLAQTNIKANYDINGNNKVGEYKMKLVLQCDIDGSSQGSYIWKWFKGNHQISTDSDDPHHIDVNENTVKINRLVENDAGIYTCKLYNANDNKEVTHKDINVFIKPYLKLPKTATFIEGEKVELECTVHGYPYPSEVSWRFENTTIVASDKIQFSRNKNNISNAILIFNPITMANRGNYVCSGKNDHVHEPVDSTAIYVRIKDKMAALWPFLGICAEVIILCLIIFIYEKKRNKAEFEESDTDQGPETNNANDHSGGDVRHRK